MKKTTMLTGSFLLAAAAMLIGAGTAQAAYITIGDPGNDDDTVGTARGGVDYTYQIGKYAVTYDEYSDYNSSYTNNWPGVGGKAPVTGNAEDNHEVDMYDAMAYANYLTEQEHGNSNYNMYGGDLANNSFSLNYTRQEALDTGKRIYAIPTEDEWYKAAYYSLADGTYYETAMGNNNTVPQTSDGSSGWNYGDAFDPSRVYAVDKGTEEENGTYNLMGNVTAFFQTATGGGKYAISNGAYISAETDLRSSNRNEVSPQYSGDDRGIRIVAIPEPSSALLLGLGALTLAGFRRARRR